MDQVLEERASAADARKVVLHVGCGLPGPRKLHRRFKGPAWREIRLDINPEVGPDIVADMTDMGAVPPASVDAVWSSHNLEHLYAHQVPVALGEYHRVLKPGGFAYVTMPNLEAVAALVAAGKLEEPVYVSPIGPVSPIDIIYGFRPKMAAGNLFMAHRTGFSKKSLARALGRAGFVKVEVEADEHLNLWGTGWKAV